MNIDLFEKYLDGTCTVEEQQQVKAWLEKDPGLLDAWLQRAAREPAPSPMPVDMEQALLTDFRRQWRPNTVTPIRNKRRAILVWTAAAAASLLAGLFLLRNGDTIFTPHDYVTLNASSLVQKVTLPDQSLVWLKPGARLRYDRHAFGRKERVITLLEGESFFEVVHDAAHPFVVESGHIQTTDVGTAFSLRDDAPDPQVMVTVASGEVAVSHDHNMLSHILPGGRLCIDQHNGRFTTSTEPRWMAGVWKDNELQLDNVPFAELSQAIWQFYHVQLQTNDTDIRRQTYTIQLKRQLPVSGVVATVCMLNQNQFKKQTDGNYLVY